MKGTEYVCDDEKKDIHVINNERKIVTKYGGLYSDADQWYIGLYVRGVNPEQCNSASDQNDILVLVTLSSGVRGDVLRQGQISPIALDFVASKNGRQGPEQSAPSAVRVTVTDFVHGDIQLESVVDDFLPGTGVANAN